MGFSHLHFIHTIKGGLVVHIFNADSSRSPELKFKSIKAIYESEDIGIPGCQSLLHLVEGSVSSLLFTDSQFGSGAADSEMPRLRSSLRHVKCEPETCELDENGSDNQKKSGLDESGICEMTLKEMQECFKKRKKKLQKSDCLLKKDPNVLSGLGDGYSKQGCPSPQIKEEETDLEEPLITWKLKRINIAKVKNNSTGKHVHLTSKTAVSSEQIPSACQDLSLDVKKIQSPIKIKIEISESDSTCFSNGSTSEHCNGIDFCMELSDEVHKVADGNDMGNMEPDSTCISSGSTLECCEKIDFVRESFSEKPKIVNKGDTKNLEPASLTKESQNCVINEASFEYSELGESTSAHLGDKMIFGENVEISLPQMTSRGSSAAKTSPVTNNLSCDVSGSTITRSSDQISCRTNWNLTQLPIVANDGLHCIGPNCDDDRCVPDLKSEVASSGSNNHLNENGTCDGGSPCITFQDSQPSFHANSDADPVCNDSPTAHEKHFFLTTDESVSGGVDGALGCSRENLVLDAREGSTNMEVLENNHGLRCQSPPARLFLKRKVISPTSQEKLCKAMNIDGLYGDVENFKSGLNGFEATVSPKLVFKKPKNRKNGSPRSVPKGILKASHSLLVPHEGTDCSSSHCHAQKAIAFSQRQMHDIECLAMKLLNELKFMKEIMEETWNSNGCSSMPSKYTSDELRMTIENAGEVEETTKKWLSMMARDCNRFCKIMRSNEKTAAASGHGVHKQRKKITFADEAGGMLCHVKVFEDHPATPLVLESKPADPDTRS